MAFQLHVPNNSHQSHFNKNFCQINHPRTYLNFVTQQQQHQQQKFKAISNYQIFHKKKIFICQSQDKKIDASKIQFSEKDFGEAPLVNENDFEELVLKSKVPVLVDFWAPWCGPCRMIGPVIDTLQKEYGDKIKCYKLNTDESPSIATKYGIRSIPTNILFIDGEQRDSIIGAVQLNVFQQIIDKNLDYTS